MNLTVYEICAIAGVLAFIVVCVFLVRLLISAERFLKDADNKIKKTNAVFELLETVSLTLNSTWFKLFGAGLAMARAARTKSKKVKERELREEEEESED